MRPAPALPRPADVRSTHQHPKAEGQKRHLSGLGEKCAPPTPAPHCQSLPEPVKGTRLDRTRTTRGRPTPTGHRAPQARRATGRAKRARTHRPGNRPHRAAAPRQRPSRRNASPPQARTGQDHQDHAPRLPWRARPPPPQRATPSRKARPAPKPGSATRKPRPRSGNQQAESGQSQEPLPGKPDINTYTGIKQSPDSEGCGFRIITVTCLYGPC